MVNKRSRKSINFKFYCSSEIRPLKCFLSLETCSCLQLCYHSYLETARMGDYLGICSGYIMYDSGMLIQFSYHILVYDCIYFKIVHCINIGNPWLFSVYLQLCTCWHVWWTCSAMMRNIHGKHPTSVVRQCTECRPEVKPAGFSYLTPKFDPQFRPVRWSHGYLKGF